MHFIQRLGVALCLGCAGEAWPQSSSTAPKDPFAVWEKEISTIEKRLKEKPILSEGVVFAGSSTIRLWPVAESFPKLQPLNVGFGGSTIPDVTHFTPRLILKLAPKTIVFYAGDNDIAKGSSPEKVRDDFAEFVRLVHSGLPKTRIVFLSIKPSPKRWTMFDTQTKANQLIKEFCTRNMRLTYVDMVRPMLGSDRKPIADLYATDELHLSAKGYEVWSAMLIKLLP